MAACWYGGAVAVADELRRRVGDDPFRLAHLGAVDAALYAAHCVLDVAAEELDRDPTDGRAAHVRARRVRAVIEAAATETVDRWDAPSARARCAATEAMRNWSPT